MKKRTSLVSNSSSSSFIIALKPDVTTCPHCGRKDPDFEDFLHKSETYDHSEETKHIFTLSGLNEVDKKLSTDNLWFSSTEKKEEIKKKIVKLLSQKYKIVVCDISYHDEALLQTLTNLVNSKNAILIYDSEDKIRTTKGA